MKKKKVIILSVVVLLIIIIGVLVIFLSGNNREKVQERMFLSLNRISCISLNSNDNPYPDDIKSYNITTTKQTLDGYLYNDEDTKEFVYDLIKDRTINTFKHSSADVCLTSYEENAQSIILEYKARQVYYTNSKNVEYYNFSVEIDKTDKSVTLQEK